MNAVSDVVNNSPFARAVALMGPTASGKTAAALAIARALPCEIISVDSALVYREMDIGTAKPNADELASAPHHLNDIIDPRDAYSVAQFRKDAARLVQERGGGKGYACHRPRAKCQRANAVAGARGLVTQR